MLSHQNNNKLITCKSQQYNSPYLSQLLITCKSQQYNSPYLSQLLITSTNSQQYNSPYLSKLLNIIFQYKSEVQFLSFVPKKIFSDFPAYLSIEIVLFWSWALWEPNRKRFVKHSYY
jgi:hypothetical protein